MVETNQEGGNLEGGQLGGGGRKAGWSVSQVSKAK